MKAAMSVKPLRRFIADNHGGFPPTPFIKPLPM